MTSEEVGSAQPQKPPRTSWLKRMVEDTDTFAGRIFDLTIQSLIVLSLISFCIETLPDLSAEARANLWIFEVITVAIFTVEYLLRIAVADNRLGFILSFQGVIDLLAILPFYVTRTIDLRSLRAFRLFRLFRMFKLVRYGRAMRRLRVAFKSIREELVLYAMATGMVVFLAAVGIYYFENEAQPEEFASIFHAMWWAVATLTTVGYGDVYPITLGGRLFTFVILMAGLGIVSIPSGLMASALKAERQEAQQTRRQPTNEDDRL